MNKSIVTEIQYPKSLAEVGLETFEDVLRARVMGTNFPVVNVKTAVDGDYENISRSFEKTRTLDVHKKECQIIRQMLWHRSKEKT